MCFSAKASFISATLLLTISYFSFKQVKKEGQYLFAAIPALFAIQQTAEGFVWLINSKLSAYIFLILAFIIWPIYIPLSIILMEENQTRQKLIRLLCLSPGILWSLFLIENLWLYPVSSKVTDHVYYNFNLPNIFNSLFFDGIIYCSAVILPFFISSKKLMPPFGLLLAFSCIISLAFWMSCFTSVWCFFAAVLSIATIIILKQNSNSRKPLF